MAEGKKPTWRDVKAILAQKEKPELLRLIADLYSSNAKNKTFIHARYALGKQPLEPYRNTISEAVYPDVYRNEPIRLSVGKKAISDYFKATKDKMGQIELMVHYLEMGNQFTVVYGDIDGPFYASLESMFGRIVAELRKQPLAVQEQYHTRLEDVVSAARNIGWGYYDYISDVLIDYESELDSAREGNG
ncbi:MAG: hypothetical protein BECKG1743D_GA0114223_103646 [Candidatus Kentron sp. G]|nr:MAG: hypothetical protein BECKG1743F_GA0114225_103656 [Candidatus Kentron sp. G]VFN02442.1 MAG: hypothetical protein BECKG1743D_GA0114223_103646 [Candidatus Kentron sp. G]VFN06660.1 MAG: hypothetical protein BECKG1743E_GA0114224_110511 [Candidatus Kentron sp. G]